jgi:DNA polymerase
MQHELEQLKLEIQACDKCSLRENTILPCWDSGNVESHVMFIGEAEGIEESKVGIPFIGKSGKYLSRLMLGIGIRREDIFVSNIVMCRPVKEVTNSDRAPTDVEIEGCSDYLIRQISIIKPRLLVALGKTSFKFLTESNDTIFNAKGNLYNYKNDNDIKVYPVLHPSYLLTYGTPPIILDNWIDWLKLKGVINEYSA